VELQALLATHVHQVIQEHQVLREQVEAPVLLAQVVYLVLQDQAEHQVLLELVEAQVQVELPVQAVLLVLLGLPVQAVAQVLLGLPVQAVAQVHQEQMEHRVLLVVQELQVLAEAPVLLAQVVHQELQVQVVLMVFQVEPFIFLTNQLHKHHIKNFHQYRHQGHNKQLRLPLRMV
jgi:hypothetical protein